MISDFFKKTLTGLVGWKGWVLSAAAASFLTYQYMDAQADAKDAGFKLAESQAALAQAEKYAEVNEALHALAGELRQTSEQWREQVKVVTVRVKDEVTKIEYRCPVPASGVRLYREAAFGDRSEAAPAAGRAQGSVRGAGANP